MAENFPGHTAFVDQAIKTMGDVDPLMARRAHDSPALRRLSQLAGQMDGLKQDERISIAEEIEKAATEAYLISAASKLIVEHCNKSSKVEDEPPPKKPVEKPVPPPVPTPPHHPVEPHLKQAPVHKAPEPVAPKKTDRHHDYR